MSKKIAIVGFAPSTRHLAPYNDPDWEIWVLNQYETILPQGGASNITRWFELHQRETVLTNHRDSSYLEKLQNSTIPIMMCKKYDDIPMSEEYPLDDIIKTLGTDYFTNSISYMVAYAIYVGATEIAMYGVDMAQDEEYAKERPSVEYFVGYARAKGIPVYIPPESDICKVPYYYGFQEESASKICKTIDPKKDDLTKRMNAADFTADEMLEHIDFYLKSYMFNNKHMVENLKETEQKIMAIMEVVSKETDEAKRRALVDEANKLRQTPVPVGNIVFPMHDILMKIWECNQALRGSKKERLYLAGATDISLHLRKILCPFD